MGELLNCPFCGSQPVDAGIEGRYVECTDATCPIADHCMTIAEWNRRTHPQPVTPAGGEVEPATVVHNADTPGHFAIITPALPAGTKLYTHPPVADASLSALTKIAAFKDEPPYTSCQGRQVKDMRSIAEEALAALNQRGGGDV